MNGSQLVILLGQLLLGMAAGFVMHRADFCMTGIFRDLFLTGRRTMLYALLLMITCLIPLYLLAHQAGLVLYPFPLLEPPSLANLLGGLLFGIGMVLAGSCVVGSLYRMGSGSTLSAAAVLGLIVGSLGYAELDGWWLSMAPLLALGSTAVTLPQLLELPAWLPGLLLVGLATPLLLRWQRRGLLRAPFGPEGYIQPWQAALLLVLIAFLSTVLAGIPLGVTTSYAKLAGYLLLPLAPDHLASLGYFKLQNLDFSHPLFGIRLKGGPGPVLDGIALIQLPLMAGLVAGGALSALRLGELQCHFKAPVRQYLSAFCGGVVMGLASRLAPACNVWHLTGGLPIMALQSILFVVGLLPGTWLGIQLLTRLVLRS